MNCIIPFTKDIKFKTNIGEILSVSLEHEYTANNSEILGNFIVTGEYKSHEVSVNKEHFEHVLPFSVDVSSRIDTDSIDFAIEDFTYEVVDNETLRVNIEYSINALEMPVEEVEEKKEDEINFENLLDEIDREMDEANEKEQEEVEVMEEPEVMEDKNIEEEKERDEEMVEEIINEVDENTQNTILEGVTNAEDLYVTYKIHIMQETDTVEAICTKYNISGAMLGEYNDITNLTTGDKVVIPQVDE